MTEVRESDLVDVMVNRGDGVMSKFQLRGATLLMALRFASLYELQSHDTALFAPSPEQRAMQHLIVKE